MSATPRVISRVFDVPFTNRCRGSTVPTAIMKSRTTLLLAATLVGLALCQTHAEKTRGISRVKRILQDNVTAAGVVFGDLPLVSADDAIFDDISSALETDPQVNGEWYL